MAAVTLDNLNGYFKERYAPFLMDLIPDNQKLMKALPFSKRTLLGNFYHQPVVVGQEHGVTYALSGAGAYTLNASVPMNTQDAQIRGVQNTIRSQIAIETISNSQNDEASFGRAVGTVVKSMMDSLSKRIEIQMFYGGDGIGTKTAAAAIEATSTTATLVLEEESFAPGIWAGLAKAIINFYNGNTLISTGANANFAVVSMDYATYTLTVSGTTQGIDDLVAAGTAALNIFFLGSKGNEMIGLKTILTTDGELFGIDNQVWDLFKGNELDAAGMLTIDVINAAIEKNVAIGGLNEDVVAYIPTKAWMSMNTDLAALRVFDQSYDPKKATNGYRKIEYYSLNGKVTIEPHPIVKYGDAFILNESTLKRIGSTDITFQPLSGKGNDFFTPVQDSNAIELRGYSNQALLCTAPRQNCYISGITYT